MSPDTLDQFSQALHNHYGNWHPPTFAALWHLLLPFSCSTLPMLVLQLLMLWIGTGLLLDLALRESKPLALVIAALVLSPVVQNVAGNVWKDLHMSLSWYLATAWLLHAWYRKRTLQAWEFVGCLLLIWYGTWVRLSGFPGSLPILYLLWRQSALPLAWRRHALSAAAACLLTIVGLQSESLFAKRVLHADDNHIEYKLILHDLTGMSLRTGQNCFPSFITSWHGFDSAYVFSRYSPATFDHIWWNPDGKSLFPELDNDRHTALQSHWRSVVLAHPLAYIKLKYEGSMYFLRWRNSGSNLMIMFPYICDNPYGFRLPDNHWRDRYFLYIEHRADKVYMKPWFWVIVNLVLYLPLLLPPLRSMREPLLMLNLSASLYLFIHFFVYPADTEFRYFYWYSLCLLTAAFWITLSLLGSLHRYIAAKRT